MSTFSDTIFTSSDLNRRSGLILDTALKTPVTITRNNDQFALVERNVMTELSSVNHHMDYFIELTNVVRRVDRDETIEQSNGFKWVEEFDSEERCELLEEVYSAYRKSKMINDWSLVKNVIHEWRESAIALASDELDDMAAALA